MTGTTWESEDTAHARVAPSAPVRARREGPEGRLCVTGLRKSYGATTVLDGYGSTAPERAPLVLRGGNGSGKTTLLRCLAGAEPLDGGEVLLDGLPQQTSSMAWWSRVHRVLDDLAWFLDLTLADHLRLMDPAADASAALERFGVGDLADRLAASLSSNQLRRSALATVLLRPWDALLLDEPEQRLDDDRVARLADVVVQLSRERRVVVLSTHSDALTALVGGEVLHLPLAGG